MRPSPSTTMLHSPQSLPLINIGNEDLCICTSPYNWIPRLTAVIRCRKRRKNNPNSLFRKHHRQFIMLLERWAGGKHNRYRLMEHTYLPLSGLAVPLSQYPLDSAYRCPSSISIISMRQYASGQHTNGPCK